MPYRTLSEAEYADIQARILYEDNHLLIFYKRIGEIAQGDKTGDEPLAETLKAFISRRDAKPGEVFLGVPHRLDRPVEGILVLAKTSKALERLSALFREGGVHKTYWALCCGAPDPEEATLEDYLVRNEKQNKSYVTTQKTHPAAKLARLHYKLLAHTDRYHLVEVELFTGRHHQIRCQLAHIGCPIKGDLKYGAPRSNPDGGISLQAHRVELIHPVRKTPLEITVPPPGSWKGIPASSEAVPRP